MNEITTAEAHAVWRQAERLKKVSDRLIGFGPFGIGLDGATALIPIVGTVFSAVAGGFVIWQGVKAKASIATLARMIAYVAADTIASDVPIIGQIADVFFPGHLMAAGALQKDIVRRFGPPDELLRPGGSSSTAPSTGSAPQGA